MGQAVRKDFYPRPPRGGRHHNIDATGHDTNFYPRPPRGGRHAATLTLRAQIEISIHALREEGDTRNLAPLATNQSSIHALREEGDRANSSSPRRSLYFYPRPPRGGRHPTKLVAMGYRGISIHALREEGDDGWEEDDTT